MGEWGAWGRGLWVSGVLGEGGVMGEWGTWGRGLWVSGVLGEGGYG